jgi:hypothetical protein
MEKEDMKKFYPYLFALVIVFTPAGCEQEPAASKSAVVTEQLFTGIVSSAETGLIAKGGTRQFIADTGDPVRWSVEGGAPESGTAVSEDGVLTVGTGEDNITLLVRAENDGTELGTATVKVKGWKDLSGKLDSIFSNGYGDGGSRDIGITAAAYGNGRWVIAGHSYEDWMYPAVAWSDDEGDTWTPAAIPHIYEDYPFSIAYGGPAGGEKFVIGGYIGGVSYSADGATWTWVHLFQSFTGNGGISRNAVYSLVYGGGLFVASNGSSQFAYSPDGVSWMYGDMGLSFLSYGSGLADGKRVSMFRGLTGDYPGTPVYSTDGVNWTTLTPEVAAAQRYIPAVPSAGYKNIAVQAMNTAATTAKGGMFTKIFGDANDADFPIMSVTGKYVPCPDDPAVYVYQKIAAARGGGKYNNYVKFIVPGGGKYLVVGAGSRAAIAHAEAF